MVGRSSIEVLCSQPNWVLSIGVCALSIWRKVQILSECKYLHLLDLRCYLMKALAYCRSAR